MKLFTNLGPYCWVAKVSITMVMEKVTAPTLTTAPAMVVSTERAVASDPANSRGAVAT